MSSPQSVSWWLERLEGVVGEDPEWKAICPAHPDIKPSLSISRKGDKALVHCFAGCTYTDILGAVEDGTLVENVPKVKVVSRNGTHGTSKAPADEWWESYTGVDKEKWKSWGVVFEKDKVYFTWPGVATRKYRQAGSKDFQWTQEGAPKPPFWPQPDKVLPERVWLTEGESDCGVLRNAGLPALAITKGGAVIRGIEGALGELYKRGAREVVLAFDVDPQGKKGVENFSKMALEAKLIPVPVDLDRVLDPLLGEKDLRDLWLRVCNQDEFRTLLLNLVDAPAEAKSSGWLQVDDFLALPIPPEPWLVEHVWLNQTIGMIVGAPKMGKSWLALDLAVSVASGKPFLGEFEARYPGPVVVISKEDPDYLLQDRLEKIMISKGLGGSVSLPRVVFPGGSRIPLYLDLTRDFLFTGPEVDSLLNRLALVKAEYGRVALVVFDPILRMLSGTDEFKASEVNTAVFQTAARIQREIGAGVVLVHHRSKHASDGKSSYGSIAFHAFSENSLYLLGDEPDDEGWVTVREEFKSERERAWSYRFSDLEEFYSVEVVHEGKATLSLQDVMQGVLDLLRGSYDGMTTKEILAAFDGSATEAILRKVLSTLDKKSQVHRQGMKWFSKEV